MKRRIPICQTVKQNCILATIIRSRTNEHDHDERRFPLFGRSILLIVGIMLCTSLSLHAQVRLIIAEACSYFGENIEGEVYGFASDSEAESAVDRIMRFTGLPQNFTIKAANVPNAAAVIRDNKRLILYNQTFMERVKERTNTDWAAISILAHEIGHHLSGHTLEPGGSRPETELQADKFSGYILYKMGATLEQSQKAMDTMTGEGGSETHPPKSARLAAIANGWVEARQQANDEEEQASARQPRETERSTNSAKPPAREKTTDYPEHDPEYPPSIQPNEPAYVAQCVFQDGTQSFVMPTGDIVMNYMGMTLQIGRRIASNDPRFSWLYVIDSSDPTVSSYLQMMGVSGVTYGIDPAGNIWSQNNWGQPVQMGRVIYTNR